MPSAAPSPGGPAAGGLFEPLLTGPPLELPDGPLNVSRRLVAEARARPAADAVRWRAGGGWAACSFHELESRSARIGSGLLATGLRPGDRVCVFVRPGPELIAVVYGLLREGLVPVLIDPGMGARRLAACARSMAPRGFIGVAAAQAARRLFRSSFASVRTAVSVGGGLQLGARPLREIETLGVDDAPVADTRADDEAAILFTSGSTGPPKGVVVTHRIFEAQTRALQQLYGFTRGEVDVACFPLFALFDNALGMTSVFPELDPSHPARCSPAKVAAAIRENDATLSFGSPAIWRRIVPWAEANGQGLAPLRRVLIAGAPVPPGLIAGLRPLLAEGGDVHTPYGATESLPVSSIAGAEVLDPRLRTAVEGGRGTCVGAAAPGIELAVLRVTDGALERPDAELALGVGQLGELAVRGAVVTPAYAELPEATEKAKIRDPRGGLWHRMGDLGFVDAERRVWFCGRVSHRIETAAGMLAPVPLENVFNAHPAVRRSALVGVGAPGQQRPVLIVEREPQAGGPARAALAAELLEHGRAAAADAARVERVLFKRRFPVDVRHNAKIHRLELAAWAARRMGVAT